MIIYIFAFVLGCGALVTLTVAPNLSESLRRSAFYLVILAGLVHTFGLVFRMALEGRPPPSPTSTPRPSSSVGGR